MIPLQKLYPKMWRKSRLRKKLRANSFHYICKKRKPKDFGDFMGCYLDSAYDSLAAEIRRKDYLLSRIDKGGWKGGTVIVPFKAQ
jgi:hypothetical protein